MSIKRYLRAHVPVIVSAIMFTGSLTAQAQNTEPVSTQIIQFSGSEHLSADNALQILTQRLNLSAGEELRSVYIERPGEGLQVQRFNQYYKGIPIVLGTYTLSSKDGIASYACGKHYPVSGALKTQPLIDEASAMQSALAFIRADTYQWQLSGAPAPSGSLAYMEDFGSGEPDGKLHLAYAFDIYAAAPLSRNMVYVDAQSGKVLFTDAILKHVAATGKSYYSDTVGFQVQQIGSKYYMHDLSRGKGIFTYNLNHQSPGAGGGAASNVLEDSSSSTFFALDPSVDAHWGAEIVYDYWKNRQNRLSWNGKDSALKSYVHYGTNYVNAFWSGSDMNYGDGGSGYGVFTALDVCGHEIGHGVCQSTCALIYNKESGAMNEGFSDIWGAVIENYGNPHEIDATPKNPWLIGEELNPTPLRSMADPKLYGQPDTYQGANWVYAAPGCTTGDNCGVHTNSGVLNHWFYLLSVGGKGVNDLNNAWQVKGLGIDSAARIAFATELAITSSATYANCRAASIAATTTLYGACSPQVEAVTRAWYAVGVGTDFAPCTPQVSFGNLNSSYTEDAANNQCIPSHVIAVPVVMNGPALTGNNAIVTATPIGGTAIAGVDYTITKSVDTFNAGGSTTQYIYLNILDNGTIGTNKYVDLVYSLNAGSSNATRSSVLDTTRVTILNDDRLPDAGGQEQHQLMVNNATGDLSSPFQSKYKAAHNQYIYRADELKAAGIRAGVPITSINLFVTNKYSGATPFTNFTIGMINTPVADLTPGFVTGTFTQVYSANFTTNTGTNTLALSTPFIWNGTDNVAVEVCFSNTTNVGNNDRVQAQASSYTLADYSTSTVVTTSGCSLPFVAANLVGSRPVMVFTQDVPATIVEKALQSTRTWAMDKNQDIYFYNQSDKQLIAAVLHPSDSLGCVTTSITAAGNGFVPAISGGGQRSVKEFFVGSFKVPSSTFSYDGIFYMDTAELAGQNPANLQIVQTSAATDNAMTAANTKIVVPGFVYTGADYYGFRGTFTGLNRYFLLMGNLALGVNGPAVQSNELWTGMNPFTDAPVLYWNLQAPELVTIRMMDITGKLVYSQQSVLNAGQNHIKIKSQEAYVAGTYILQVIRPGSVYTRQMIKQ